MTGPLALSPLESLLRLSPLACGQALLIAVLSGEATAFYTQITAPSLTTKSFEAINTPASEQVTQAPDTSLPLLQLLLVLAGNGILAFVLNIASFSTNKYAGALTMTVCGNVKQCLTVLLGIALFGVRVSMLNGVGMAVALAGAAWYSAVELAGKTVRSKG
jgi:hypothetical protein